MPLKVDITTHHI